LNSTNTPKARTSRSRGGLWIWDVLEDAFLCET